MEPLPDVGEGGPGAVATPGLELPASLSAMKINAISNHEQVMGRIKMDEWRTVSGTYLGSGCADRLRHLLIDQLYALAGKKANLQDQMKMIGSGSELA